MRTITHLVDTKSIKKVIFALPDYWVVRELTERDYGIDLMVEVFLKGPLDKKGREVYRASGALFHIQIKGTQKLIEPKDGAVFYRLKKSTLRYVENFSVPFLLFRTDVSSPSAKTYFLWLQRYIRDVLDVRQPLWREEASKSIPLLIPETNEVGSEIKKLQVDALERIQRIALRPKYLEELIEFREIFRDVDDRVSAILGRQHDLNRTVIEELRNRFLRIRRLTVLLTQNEFGVDRACVDETIEYLERLDVPTKRGAGHGEIPHRDRFELLSNSVDGMALVENFVAESEGGTMY